MSLLDATVGALVALMSIWVAVGRGHWFWRFLVVVPFLLAPLLIPAYELVFHHSLAVMLIIAGVWIYQRRRPWPQRFSVATLLLATTVFALIGAVLVKAPRFDLNQWLGFVGIATAIASIALLSLWAVSSDRHWWLRTRVCFYCGFFLAVGGHAICAMYYANQWTASGWSWGESLAHCYSLEWLAWWWEYYVIGAVLAAAFLVALLILARGTRWFAPMGTENRDERRFTTLAFRLTFVALLLAIGTFPSYVFYRLLTPTPFPPVVLPVPNGYDDFVAAGNMITDRITAIARNAHTMPIAQLKAEVDDLIDVVARVDQGLEKECHVSKPYHVNDEDYLAEQEALLRTWCALHVHLAYLKRSGNTGDCAQASVRVMRFGHEASRGAGTGESWLESSEQIAVSILRKLLGRLTPIECRELALELARLDSRREPHSVRAARQRLIDQHREWVTHVQQLFTEWSGEKVVTPRNVYYWRVQGIADARLLIGELAIHAYLDETGALPQTLDDLVPTYLPAVPLDPLGDGPLGYVLEKDGYKLYSCGSDRDDDGGESEDLAKSNGGDMVVTGPVRPPLWLRIGKHLESHWKGLWKSPESVNPTQR